jgi:ribosomal protein L35
MHDIHRHLAEALTAERTRELPQRRLVHERQRELVRASLLIAPRDDHSKGRR